MRRQVAERLRDETGEEQLSTGEAAAVLGVSRQHVVDLCDEGMLPHSWAGKHRRVRRGDVEAIAAGSHRVTRDQVRSLLLAHATAGRIVADPEGALQLARANLRAMRQSAPRGSAHVWMQEWERLLDGPLTDLLAALTAPSQRSRELRQNSPFAGLLSDDERQQVLSAFRSATSR